MNKVLIILLLLIPQAAISGLLNYKIDWKKTIGNGPLVILETDDPNENINLKFYNKTVEIWAGNSNLSAGEREINKIQSTEFFTSPISSGNIALFKDRDRKSFKSPKGFSDYLTRISININSTNDFDKNDIIFTWKKKFSGDLYETKHEIKTEFKLYSYDNNLKKSLEKKENLYLENYGFKYAKDFIENNVINLLGGTASPHSSYVIDFKNKKITFGIHEIIDIYGIIDTNCIGPKNYKYFAQRYDVKFGYNKFVAFCFSEKGEVTAFWNSPTDVPFSAIMKIDGFYANSDQPKTNNNNTDLKIYTYNGNTYYSEFFQSKKSIIEIQKNLQNLNYYQSSIDGLVGYGTLKAIIDWKTDNNYQIKKNIFENIDYNILNEQSLNPELYAKKPEFKEEPKIEPKQETLTVKKEEEFIPAASGTGFFINSKGNLITNNHVIDMCDRNYVFYDGKKFPAYTIGVDRVNDLAVLISDISPKSYFGIESDDALLLDDVIVAGYPLGRNISASIKTTKGSITSLAGFGDNYSNFQTDAALNQGNSGGPIINDKGNVVGVAVAVFGKEQGIESFNFGIKSSVLKTFINSFGIKYGEPADEIKNNRELSNIITQGTVYLECWMTFAKLEKLIRESETQKAFFPQYKD